MSNLFLALFASLSLATGTQAWQPAGAPLTTRWTKLVSPTNALVEYPRPQMVRSAWQNLNGLWDYALGGETPPTNFAGKILVPYPLESALSGLAMKSVPDKRLWYRREFSVPASWKGQHVLLHFGAVNWDSTIFVNGTQVGAHRGGYDAFDLDVTDHLKPGSNELMVSASNPLLSDNPADQILGKQRLHPSGIFYTAATGIWQTVWLEPVSPTYVADFLITPDVDKSNLKVNVDVAGGEFDTIQVVATDQGKVVAKSVAKNGRVAGPFDGSATLAGGVDVIVPIPNPHLWSPEDPHLYGLQINIMKGGKAIDHMSSYFAMRKIGLGKDDKGRTVLFLNNKPSLQIGALDQGYWPDGIYTAPTDAALRYDIETAKKLGFNLLRKHAKVEPERWYYWADRLGMLVWQDMPQGFSGEHGEISSEGKAQYLKEWQREIATHYNHPSIVVWTTFNEGWGQHDTAKIVTLTKQLDPTRLVNNASGWNDMKVGDIADTHAYPGPGSGEPEPDRAIVNGEFGGVTMRIPGHMWTQDVFGYGKTLTDTSSVTRRYQELLKLAYGLHESKGTSAFVYTQLTDVEQESNGLLTYDRAVIKPDAKAIAAANRGVFLPLPSSPKGKS